MRRMATPLLILSCLSALLIACYGRAFFRGEQFGYRDAAHYYYPLYQRVQIADTEFFFAAGQSIRTEYSYKYTSSDLRDLALAAGFEMEKVWMDERKYFGVYYFRVVGGE